MKLSAQLIIYHLRQHFSAAASSWLSSEPHLEYPVIYQSPGPLAGGKIYISDDPDFLVPSHHLSETLVILTGKSRYLEEDDYPNLCIFAGKRFCCFRAFISTGNFPEIRRVESRSV